MSDKVSITGGHGGELAVFLLFVFMVYGDPNLASKLHEFLMAWLDANTL